MLFTQCMNLLLPAVKLGLGPVTAGLNRKRTKVRVRTKARVRIKAKVKVRVHLCAFCISLCLVMYVHRSLTQ